MARAIVALAAASLLLAALAGCSALPGQDGPPGTTLPGTAESTTTTEPPIVVETTTEPTTAFPSEQYLPGLTADGVVDPRELVGTHHERLSETAYTLHLDMRDDANDASDPHPVVDAAFGTEPGRLRWRLDSRTANASRGFLLQAWGNDTHLHQRFTSNGTTRYDRLAVPPGERTNTDYLFLQPSQRERLYRLFAAFAVENVTVRETADGRRYRLTSTTVAEKGALVSASEQVENATLTATLDDEGVVRRLHAEYDVHLGDDVQRVVYDLRVTGVGTTTVERPDWVNTSAEPSENSVP